MQKIFIVFLIISFLIMLLLLLVCCQKRAKISNGWKHGRYDFASNISHAEMDKVCYDLGTPSARKILQSGWGNNVQSLDGKNYVVASQRTSIIELPPQTATSRVILLTAFPFLTHKISSLSVALYLNGHLLKEIKLQPGWSTYLVPIKGKYFSLKGNTLILEHTHDNSTSLEGGQQEGKKPFVGYDKLCLIKKELVKRVKEVKPNFLLLNQLRLAGDTRPVLETRGNNHFSYQLSIAQPAELHFSLGLPEEKAQKIEQIEYQILAAADGDEEKLLFSRLYHADKDKLWKNWNEFTLDLSPYAGSNLSLSFKTRLVEKKGHAINTICWGNPFLIKQQDKGKEKLNVIIYLVDTLRADHLGCYGDHEIKTPNIDRFASQGVLFERAYSQASWTKPSTATLLTSTYPSYHGAITREDGLTKKVTTIAECLRDEGYLTTGFINNPNIVSDFGFHQGFDSYIEIYQQLKQRPLYAHHMNQLILPWLEKSANMPFFLYIHTVDPHDPYNPPPPFNTMYDNNYQGSINGLSSTLCDIEEGKIKVAPRDIQHLEALYDAEITLNDEAFGELIEKLKELQLYNRTLVLFTSDHGEEFYEHHGVKHGDTLYEEQVHIPIIIRDPFHFPSEHRIGSMVGIIDIMPTILRLLNISVPAQCEGKSLIPLIRDEKNFFVADLFFEEDLDGKIIQAVRRKQWKLIFYPKTDKLELFNLEKDAEEKHNVASEYPELASSLYEEMKHWHQKQIEQRAGLLRPKVHKLSEETIRQLKALGYLN
jgi:arylsulfatase A-like enzyme